MFRPNPHFYQSMKMIIEENDYQKSLQNRKWIAYPIMAETMICQSQVFSTEKVKKPWCSLAVFGFQKTPNALKKQTWLKKAKLSTLKPHWIRNSAKSCHKLESGDVRHA